MRLYPGFVDLKEADWVLEQLCQDVPWKQRTGIREGEWVLELTGVVAARSPCLACVLAPLPLLTTACYTESQSRLRPPG